MKILVPKDTDQFEFIDFWSKQYDYGKEHLYDDNIHEELTDERVLKLFEWKNGTPISGKKMRSIEEHYLADQTIYPKEPSIELIKKILDRPGGAIWRIFWVHCHYPERYPIYDQHVHRAMAHIQGWNVLEIPSYNKKKIQIYLNDYIPFYDQFKEIPYKKVDEAL